MRHAKWKTLLSGYLDKELDPRRTAAFEKHLAGCKDCAEELAALRKLEAFAGDLSPLPEDDAYWSAFSGRVKAGIVRAQASGAPRKEADMFNDSFFAPTRNIKLKAFVFPLSAVAHVVVALLMIILPLMRTGSLPEVEVYSAFLAPPP
ncbi:MAG: zf-HC2 domain-containing protein, partial [Candidatus Aminicenantes bacterium]|nr:zf-HC2 domain-containing protein [Candidatus Aminicenantes bacterium]